MATNSDDLAYPLHVGTDKSIFINQKGLTKREYFASQILPALIVSQKTVITTSAPEQAVRIADQLIRELNNS